ncbi:MAG: threonine synthase [Sulfuricurvum sp. PC08-66]|nr:MAG: threonine synthase [Sulfuricurvum sp. PC08-66]
MQFIETRGNDGKKPFTVPFSEAILRPIASFGGLYVPQSLPQLSGEFFRAHLNSDYKTLAMALLEACAIDIPKEVLQEALSLYDNFDDATNPVPVVKVKPNLYVSELYHGPTRAFKDMALQPFGVILSHIAQSKNENYLILAATSGDTGPAALDTFRNRANVQVACLYPDGGTSDVQRLQMVTEEAKNLKVIGIKGVFDDAQNALKFLLDSPAFNAALKEHHISLSAANSVNFGRIIFQIIYHVYSYLALVRANAIAMGEPIELDVPSGNFGNALGGYYAMRMGLPVQKILIASNQNNILTELINEGRYDLRTKEVVMTTSPAMDILKSSNVERILFDLFGAQRTKELMQNLEKEHFYELTQEELKVLRTIFAADYCTNEEGNAYMKEAFEAGYLMDPHTATCFKSHATQANPKSVTIAYSTAEWTKFAPNIAYALTGQKGLSDKEALQLIAQKAGISIPSMIAQLFDKEVCQSNVIEKSEIEATILKFLDVTSSASR